MRATINVEFTDDELRKYAEDVGRRWAMNFFQEMFKTGKRLKIPPGLVQELVGAFKTGAAEVSKPQDNPGPTAGVSPPPTHEASSLHDARVPLYERCIRVAAATDTDEGWYCCHCGSVNGVHRMACRFCRHTRCDIVVPPPPSPPRPTDPSVQ